MHLFLADPDFAPFLADELRRHAPAAVVNEVAELGFTADVSLDDRWLAFARQTLPDAVAVQSTSINAWADRIIDAIAGHFPDDQPWRLHLWPQYGEGKAGLHRCELIQARLVERLKKRRRRLLRSLVKEVPSPHLSPLQATESNHVWGGVREQHSQASKFSQHAQQHPSPRQGLTEPPTTNFGERLGEGQSGVTAAFTPETSLVQCVLTSPEAGWISIAIAPHAFAHRSLISSFPRGEVPLADDKSAPSRAFTKLVETEQRLGRQIERGQTCVDLGASPGSWSYVAIQRGAQVIAVDRSELREDLMRHPRLRFETADAFKYQPPQTVDWLVCDVIAAPQRSIDLLLEWLREKRMRNFIVTIKFKGNDEYPLLETLKREAPPLCAEFHLTRLCANKNEVCAFGVA